MNINFAGQSVLIAGAARGIGRGIVEAFAARGANVFAGDRLSDEMAGLPAHQTQLDLLNKAELRGWIAQSQTLSGRSPDVLVYVAGGVLGQSAKPLEEVDEEAWRAVLDVNLTGAFLFAQAAGREMLKRQSGCIINVASAAGLHGSVAGPHYAGYAAAKAGLMGLTRELAASWGPKGIRVNAIAPGFFHSRLTERVAPDVEPRLKASSPLGRIGGADELKGVAVFLASEASSYMTGQTLVVDGGVTIAGV